MTNVPSNNSNPPQRPSRDLVRALDHLSALEKGEIEERYGVAPSLFARFGMFPLTPPDENAPMWTRRNPFGAVTITRGVQLDEVGDPQLARYPFGGIPRLFLIDLVTEVSRAIKAGAEHPEVVDLTSTLNRYTTERLGLRKGSRNRAVLEQIVATARATITFSQIDTDAATGRRKATAWDAPKVADAYSVWLPNQNTLAGLEPSMTLSRGFMQMIENDDEIPVRRDLLARIAGKPMAFDALIWLAAVTFWLDISGKREAFFDWPYLFVAFTHEYTTLKNFTAALKVAVTEALRYYPDCRVELMRGTRAKPGGIRVSRSPLLIAPMRQR